jgi:hypothetical protein
MIFALAQRPGYERHSNRSENRLVELNIQAACPPGGTVLKLLRTFLAS